MRARRIDAECYSRVFTGSAPDLLQLVRHTQSETMMRVQKRGWRFMSAFAREVPMAPADPILSLKALIREVRIACAFARAYAAHA